MPLTAKNIKETWVCHRADILAGIGEIANISNAERQTPNAERQKFWTDRSVVWILIFLEKFEKISSADFIAKNLKTISSAEFIDADFIEKKFALLISLKKIPTVDFIEKNFSNPKTTDRSFSNPQPKTPNPKPRFSRTDRSFLSSFPTRSNMSLNLMKNRSAKHLNLTWFMSQF